MGGLSPQMFMAIMVLLLLQVLKPNHSDSDPHLELKTTTILTYLNLVLYYFLINLIPTFITMNQTTNTTRPRLRLRPKPRPRPRGQRPVQVLVQAQIVEGICFCNGAIRKDQGSLGLRLEPWLMSHYHHHHQLRSGKLWSLKGEQWLVLPLINCPPPLCPHHLLPFLLFLLQPPHHLHLAVDPGRLKLLGSFLPGTTYQPNFIFFFIYMFYLFVSSFFFFLPFLLPSFF